MKRINKYREFLNELKDSSNIFVKDIDNLYMEDVYRLINDEFYSNGVPFIGLFDNNKIIGAILLEEEYLPYEYRFDIIIDKNYRNKGYSKLLIKDLIDKFKKDKDVDDLIAWIINDNLKNMLIKDFGFDEWLYDGETFVGLNKNININESKVITCSNKKLSKEIIEYVSKFKSDEELLRSGGIPIDMLDKLAFGFSEIDTKTLKPTQLKILWIDDLENVKYYISNNNLNLKLWAKSIDLTEPIDVDYWEDIEEGFERGFYIQDGHHRYYAAKILNKELNVNLKIKVNPIKELSNLSYDDFHRCIFKEIKPKTVN